MKQVKKVLVIIIGILAIMWITVRIFMFYNANNVLNRQVVFEIYMDESINIDDYFNLPKGTFDVKKHILVCKLPVYTDMLKPEFVFIKNDLSYIDCKKKYRKGSHIKYENYELKGDSFDMMIVNMYTNLNSMNTLLWNEKNIVGKKVFSYNYETGKINHLVISKDRIYEYCNE
jgi:hypothetical protein